MPEPIQQSPNPVPQGNDVVPGEGNRNAEDKGKVSSQPESSPTPTGGAGEMPAELKLINELTGREYKSLDDAKKGVKETYGYVGTLGQKSSVVDKLVERIAKENGVEPEVALQHLQELAAEAKAEEPKEEPAGQKAPDVRPNNLQDANSKFLAEKVQELSFLQDKPDAKPYIDVIRDIHRGTGKDFTTIFNEQISPLLAAGKKAAYETQEVKGGQGVPVTGNNAPPVDTYGETLEAWMKNPKKTSVMDVLAAKGMKIVPEE